MWTTANQSTCVFSNRFTRGWLAAGWTVLATGRTGRTSASRVRRLHYGEQLFHTYVALRTDGWQGCWAFHFYWNTNNSAMSSCTDTSSGPSLLNSNVFFSLSALQVQTQPRTYVALVSSGWCTLCTLSWTQRLCHWLETSTSYHNTLHRYLQVKKGSSCI